MERSCVDECARLHFETRSREADEPEPGAQRKGLIFAGTSNLVALRWLMLLGANAKARDRNGTTLLHAACRSGSFLVAQAQINPHVQNKRGATPLDLCSDVSTREALRTFALKTPEVTSRINSVEEFQRLARVQGEVGEDPTATCEPFFVPRQPVFEDEAYGAAHGSHGSWRRRHFLLGQAHYKVLVNIGLEMLGASSPALRIRGEWTRSRAAGPTRAIAPMIFLADQRCVSLNEGSRQPIVLFKAVQCSAPEAMESLACGPGSFESDVQGEVDTASGAINPIPTALECHGPGVLGSWSAGSGEVSQVSGG
ncbi:hypothetical protein AK812_SmicGene36885 [Symbiodinium microadriaticum]|uniref:Uncharacterized protein n=1 Tax=Symbiodinium microadriaticum TaxID=2951 RepID=A0A1Q9CHR1_SYMMI|nr:hypothetical protein AK812_SmicGene36885 [Symbiodinium microadriaticum]